MTDNYSSSMKAGNRGLFVICIAKLTYIRRNGQIVISVGLREFDTEDLRRDAFPGSDVLSLPFDEAILSHKTVSFRFRRRCCFISLGIEQSIAA